LAKIAVEFEQALARHGATAGRPLARLLAAGEGWTVEDLVCRSGPQDRPFEERHSLVSIAIVLAGTFQYRAANGRRGAGELMTPGSVLLGNAGEHFECGHEHGVGDRCLSFRYTTDYFESIAAYSGAGRGERVFRMLRLPVVRALSPLVARARAGLPANSGRLDDSSSGISWEELAIQLAVSTLRLANRTRRDVRDAQPSAVARVTRAVRMIEESRESELTVGRLAHEARLSPYHFLRIFVQLTCVTPHQYVRRARLRDAAMRLAAERAKVSDIALDCGFGDVSNFNRAFRSEFGLSPREFRAQRSKYVIEARKA